MLVVKIEMNVRCNSVTYLSATQLLALWQANTPSGHQRDDLRKAPRTSTILHPGHPPSNCFWGYCATTIVRNETLLD